MSTTAPKALGGADGETRQGVLGCPSPAPLKLVLVSAVALLDKRGRVLLAQRPEGKAMAGLWEFPGGKVRA